MLLSYLSLLTEQVAARLRAKESKAKTVNIKIRFHDFTTIVRSKTLPQSTQQTHDIWLAVKSLFQTAMAANTHAVRLLGVGVSGFGKDETFQGDLFSNEVKHAELDEVTDQINQRFGQLKIHRGRNTT